MWGNGGGRDSKSRGRKVVEDNEEVGDDMEVMDKDK
jgi:hypothetical protein